MYWYVLCNLALFGTPTLYAIKQLLSLVALYGLAHVAEWELCDLHDLAHAPGVGSVVHVHRSCTTPLEGSCIIYGR